MKTIHINCDLGEGGKHDQELMPLISACNIACGGHAGTLETMQHTVDLAKEHRVEIGAHPSYPDKENFGRISVKMSAKELRRSLVAQIMSLKQITEADGAVLSHVKPHGALYNDAQKDPTVAQVVIDAVLEFGSDLVLYAPYGSEMSRLAEGNLSVKHEAFADRNYNPDGSLVSRVNSDAVLTKKEDVFRHLFSMFNEGKIICKNGENIPSFADTFCVHSDTQNSVEILKYLHSELAQNNIQIYRA